MSITFESKAWISPYTMRTPEELRTAKGAESLTFSTFDLASGGYTLAGTATITVTMLDQRVIIDNKVAALREVAAGIRAEATAKVTRIESQIQQLLCIENSSESA